MCFMGELRLTENRYRTVCFFFIYILRVLADYYINKYTSKLQKTKKKGTKYIGIWSWAKKKIIRNKQTVADSDNRCVRGGKKNI